MDMRRSRISLLAKLGIVVLTLLATAAITVRPLTQPHGRLDKSFGFRRQAPLSEAARDHDAPVPVPPATVQVVIPPLLGLLILVLKRRRTAYRALPVRRLKLLPRHTAESLLSD